MTTPKITASICEICAHCRVIVSAKGSRFLLCNYATQDPRFPKYPPQPLAECPAFAPRKEVSSE